MRRYLLYSLFCGIAIAIIVWMLCIKSPAIHSYNSLKNAPTIDPDYSGIVIPPNIAPLNFVVKDSGSLYCVKLYGQSRDTITIHSKNARINIPVAHWKRLLEANRGKTVSVVIYIKQNGKWNRYASITNPVAKDDIDEYLVYRKILGYTSIPAMCIEQRNLGSYKTKVVLDNSTIFANKLPCINCHSFCNNDPNKMIIHMRGQAQGMLLVNDKKVVKIDTRTKFNKSPASYPAWHPSGKFITFATMRVNQVLHSVDDPRVVFDESSDLIMLNIASNTISTCPQLSDKKRMETLPDWSPDGRYLYFCSANQPEKVDAAFYDSLRYKEIKYDLMRIPYDLSTNTFGVIETLLTAQKSGQSNVQPKVSPDGRYLLFVMLPYSYFAVYNDKSDLYMMDLKTFTYKKLDGVNSESTESFHSWSSNGRWFVFNSRRRDGLCGLPYFAFVDTLGNVSKPFVLPQKDPAFYETYLRSFNVPVLANQPVTVDWRELSRVAGDSLSEKIAQFDAKAIDASAGATVREKADTYAP